MNAESLLPANPNILDGVDDLMQLSYLNEPSVLYNLQVRYSQDMIYVSIYFVWDFFSFLNSKRLSFFIVLIHAHDYSAD